MTTALRPPRRRSGHTRDTTIAGHGVFLTVSEGDTGNPIEVFITLGKQGSTLAGLCAGLSMMVTLALRHGAPTIEVVKRLINQRYEPSGHTDDPEIPTVTSLADYVGRRLALDYLNDAERADAGMA